MWSPGLEVWTPAMTEASDCGCSRTPKQAGKTAPTGRNREQPTDLLVSLHVPDLHLTLKVPKSCQNQDVTLRTEDQKDKVGTLVPPSARTSGGHRGECAQLRSHL